MISPWMGDRNTLQIGSSGGIPRSEGLLHGELEALGRHKDNGQVCPWATVGVFRCWYGRVCPGTMVAVVGRRGARLLKRTHAKLRCVHVKPKRA